MNQIIYNRLIETARKKGLITYSELAQPLGLDMEIEKDRKTLSEYLEEIACHEHAAGRPMLTAIVVHKGGDNNPCEGFYSIVRTLGLFDANRNPFERLTFWTRQIHEVSNSWCSNSHRLSTASGV